MRIILNPGESLTAVLSGAAATTNPTYLVDYVKNASGYQSIGSLSGATAVTIQSAGAVQHVVNEVVICNVDTAAVTITIKKIDASAASTTLMVITLAAGDTLFLTPTHRVVFDSNGRQKQAQTSPVVGAVMSADGAISATSGVVVVTKAGVCAMTLAAPTAGTDDYKELTVISSTANAHTLTQTSPGFNGGGAASDVGTFGGAKGDGIMLVAYQGTWYVKQNTNVTLA